jgi:uroporphyrinogen-III synthase
MATPTLNTYIYFGLNPERFPHPVTHYPLIKIVPKLLQDPSLLSMWERWNDFSHILFTSQETALLLAPHVKNQTVLSIGPATQRALEHYGLSTILAPEATQEGVIELIKELNPSFLLYPHSARARPLLKTFLKARRVPFLDAILYDTLFFHPGLPPNLNYFTHAVFTSPSTVESFFALYKTWPPHLIPLAIGPITEQACKNFGLSL